MQANIANARQRWTNLKMTKMTVLWIVIGAILLTLFFGFSRGAWMTGGSAQQLSERAAQVAVVERLGAICVAQFNQDSQKDEKLGELQALTSSYQRSSYVTDQGWGTMPGETKSDNKVSTECAERLMKINE